MRHKALYIFGILILSFGFLGEALAAPETLVIYSGRDEKLLKPALEAFETKTGIRTKVLYGKTAGLFTRLQAEGQNSKCDVFFTNDVATLERADQEGLLEPLPSEVELPISERFIAKDRSWAGVTYRVRALAYNTDLVAPDSIDSILDLAKPDWKGRVATATSANSSFISGIASMIEDFGEAETLNFLEGLRTNSDGLVFPKHTPTVKAVAEGRAAFGYVNHYYVYRHLKQNPDAKVGLIYPDTQGKGLAWNLSGVALTQTARHRDAALKFITFLLSPEGQQIFSRQNFEYPTNPAVSPDTGVKVLAAANLSKTDATTLAENLTRAVELIQSSGLD